MADVVSQTRVMTSRFSPNVACALLKADAHGCTIPRKHDRRVNAREKVAAGLHQPPSSNVE